MTHDFSFSVRGGENKRAGKKEGRTDRQGIHVLRSGRLRRGSAMGKRRMRLGGEAREGVLRCECVYPGARSGWGDIDI